LQEVDQKRLASRQKQLDIGFNTPGYQRFLVLTPTERRQVLGRSVILRVPDKLQVCSKRSWEGQVRKWRRLLHCFDPTESEIMKNPVELQKASENLFSD